jgi:isoprenylcysteine carboxyl methyltransferase (ICMT) family protein YpbQ
MLPTQRFEHRAMIVAAVPYKLVKHPNSVMPFSALPELASLEAEGFELVAVQSAAGENAVLYFKRPVTPGAQEGV